MGQIRKRTVRAATNIVMMRSSVQFGAPSKSEDSKVFAPGRSCQYLLFMLEEGEVNLDAFQVLVRNLREIVRSQTEMTGAAVADDRCFETDDNRGRT